MLIVSFFFWAYHAEIDQVVRVEGKIIPAGHSRQIQHLEGGIISSISTYEGAVVRKGDLLITIKDTSAEANLNEIKIKLNGEKAKVARLKSEASGKVTISFPVGINNLAVLEAERNLFSSRKKNLNEAMIVHEELIRQHKATLSENENRSKRLKDELSVASKRSRMFEKMASKNAASQIEVLNAQSQENRLKTEIGNAISAAPKLQSEIREEQAQIEKIKASFKADVQKELIASLTEVERLTQIMKAGADRKERTEIRAPMDGVINRVGYNTIGAVVKAGQSVVELTPESSEVLIEAKASPEDRGEMQEGIDAVIRISSYDVGALGSLSGVVKEISADTVPDSKGNGYYRVKILISSIPDAYKDKDLMPGMTVQCDLVTGKRTVLTYLMSPLRKFTNNMFRDSR